MAKLEHDRELVERLALIHEGNATAHLNRSEENYRDDNSSQPQRVLDQHRMLAASGLVIAASYWSLITPRRALVLYRVAAIMYRPMGRSYWMALALASASEKEIATMPSAIDESRESGSQSIAFAMVGNEMAGGEGHGRRSERLNAEWRHLGNVPVGRLGIPLDHYGRCAQALRAAREEKNIDRFLKEGSNYVHRAAEALRGASHDRFHWLRLQSPILPAEPEAVAMTTAMSMMSHSLFGMPLSELPDLDSHGRLLVEVGEGMRNAARSRDSDRSDG